jgi:hypothetical protein
MGFKFSPDEFCWHCGSPYPWASQESIALHIENLLDEQPDLSEGDRRVLEAQLTELRTQPTSKDLEQRQIRALKKLQELAPKAWQLALPLIQSIATAEIKKQLGLPPT